MPDAPEAALTAAPTGGGVPMEAGQEPPFAATGAPVLQHSRFHRLSDRWAHLAFLACSLLVVGLIGGILFFLASRGLAAFWPVAGNTGRTLSLSEVFLSTDWAPSSDHFGIVPFIAGSLGVTGLALLIAAPAGILTGVFIAKLAPTWMRNLMRQVMDLLVGIPSVVYGIFGLTVVLPFVSGTWLAEAPASGFAVAALILAVMIVPTIVSLSTDAFESLPTSLDEGAQALGSSRWQAIWHVLIPAARPRLLTAAVLGLGRAIGEAMAVQMVIGNNPQWMALMRESTDRAPFLRALFTPAATLTTELVQELPNTPAGSPWNNVLFAMGLLLYLLTMVLILATRRLGRGKEA
ncbi:phosphate ABC transporter permease subunit PstC [Geothrix oryzisoli]|uniref:phosphate ABC transporter permease subunit PstC n=1 Tax=Geothrix oryzisoli TaxID=2922721 RepID=UPI001FAD668F|nr:phosphate ABC transporter permease subunit PstC [Geothrix oryzisoli]